MRKSLITIAVLGALAAPSFVFAAEKETKSDFTTSGSVGLFSQYIFRGLTQTDRDPALQGNFDIIVSNPPYIAISEQLDASTLHDPSMALFSGQTGLEAYEQILPKLKRLLKPKGKIFLEIGRGQELCVEKIAIAAGLANESVFTDLSGIIRVLCYSPVKA